MLRSRFLWKLYATYAVVILVTVTIVGSFVARRMVQDSLQETRQILRTRGLLLQELATAILTSPPELQTQQRLRPFGAIGDTRFTIIQRDGVVVADSEEDPAHLDNYASRPEIVEAGSQTFGTATRFSHTVGSRVMYVALPVRRNGQLLGYIRTALPLTAINERLSHLRAMVFFGAGMAAAVGLLLGFVFARRVTRPLMAMTAIASSMAGQAPLGPGWIRPQDEIGTLAAVFNRMADHLRERVAALDKERNQLLAVLTSMVEGVIAVDREERLVHLNQAAEAILLTSASESLGRRLWEVTRVPAVVETVAAIIRGAGTIIREARIVEPRRERVVAIRATPLRTDTGELAGAVVVLHDMTELRRLESMRREFVANVSHELKTPITAIKGFIETLRDGALDDREQAEHFLEIVARHADRLHAIIEDLLSLSRLEQSADTSELPRTDTALREVLQAARQDCAMKASARHVTVEVTCDSALRLRLNAPLIEQALVNLVDNAINYSKSGSTVWLEASQEGDDVIISVRDQGVGIPQEHLPRLFERFYRVDRARSRAQGGTGLGLAIVKHIVLAHKGHVSVNSAVGQGSTFTLRLPVT